MPALELDATAGGCSNRSALLSSFEGPLSGDGYVVMFLNSGDSDCALATLDLEAALNVSHGT